MTDRRPSRTTHIQLAILVLGFTINFFATIGGFVSFAMAYESRITRIETLLEINLQNKQPIIKNYLNGKK